MRNRKLDVHGTYEGLTSKTLRRAIIILQYTGYIKLKSEHLAATNVPSACVTAAHVMKFDTHKISILVCVCRMASA